MNARQNLVSLVLRLALGGLVLVSLEGCAETVSTSSHRMPGAPLSVSLEGGREGNTPESPAREPREREVRVADYHARISERGSRSMDCRQCGR